MKITRPCGRRRGQRGVAIIVVLAVVAIMAMLLAVNAQVLADLKSHILLLEKKQQQKYVSHPEVATPGPVRTNAPPRGP